MSIKKRLAAMELDKQVDDYLIVFFRTVIENRDVSDGDDIWSASVATGPQTGTYLRRGDDETREGFKARANLVSKGKVSAKQSAKIHEKYAAEAVDITCEINTGHKDNDDIRDSSCRRHHTRD